MNDAELIQLKNELKREKGSKDLFYMSKDILGHDKMTVRTHKELCDLAYKWIIKENKNCCFFMPRGTFKSSILTDGIVTQALINNPDEKILIFSETWTKGAEYVEHIKEHLESEAFKELYGNLKDPSYWRKDGIRIKGRTRLDKEPSIVPGGIDKPATGKHFTLVICEDILGETNTNTSDQLAKVQKRFEEIHSLLDHTQPSRIVVVGTLWDEEDVYCTLIKQEGITDWDKFFADRKVEGKDWNFYIRSSEKGNFFPEILGAEKLEEIKRGQSSHKFMLQFYNDPRTSGLTIFEDEWRAQAKDMWDKCPKDGFGKMSVKNKYLVIDPAISKNPSADYSALLVTGDSLDTKEDIRYILECHQERLDTLELMNVIFEIADRHKVKGIIIECSGFQKILVSMIRQEKMKLGKSYRIIDYYPGNQNSKEDRIENLIPRMRQGRLAYSRDFLELDMQFRKFPNIKRTEHDDALDCLSIAELAIPKSVELDKKLIDPIDLLDEVPVIDTGCNI